jgi:hypothetical protein
MTTPLPFTIDDLGEVNEAVQPFYTRSDSGGFTLDVEEIEVEAEDGTRSRFGLAPGLRKAIDAERRRCAELEQQHARIAGFEEIFGTDGKGLYRARKLAAGEELTADDLEAMPPIAREQTHDEASALDAWIGENAERHLAELGVQDTPENRALLASLLSEDAEVREKAGRALAAQHPESTKLRRRSAQLLDVALRAEIQREFERRGVANPDLDLAVRVLSGNVAGYFDADERPRFAALDENGDPAWRVSLDGYTPQDIRDAVDALEVREPRAFGAILDGPPKPPPPPPAPTAHEFARRKGGRR